jgi:hypothetical protein
MSRRSRVWFVATCLAAFGLLAALITRSAPDMGPSGKTPPTMTLAPA